MTDDVNAQIREIRDAMRTDPRNYFADEGMQSRLRDLYDARETGVAPSPKTAGGERAAIEKVMKTDINRYWRDPDMQARYLQLLEAEEGAVEPAKAAQDDGLDGLVPSRSPSDWKATGNDPAAYHGHVRLVRDVNDILGAVDGAERGVMGDTFAALPSTVHKAAFSMLADRRAVAVDPFNEGAMNEVVAVPAFKALAQEWGYDAPRKLAVVQARLWRVMDRLSDADMGRAVAWLDRLPKSAMIALGRKLAG